MLAVVGLPSSWSVMGLGRWHPPAASNRGGVSFGLSIDLGPIGCCWRLIPWLGADSGLGTDPHD
jgi:hypothetical protein